MPVPLFLVRLPPSAATCTPRPPSHPPRQLVQAATVWSAAVNPAILVAALLAPAGSGALSLGCLGEQFEVSEVGTPNLVMVEVTRLLLMAAAFLMAALSSTAVRPAGERQGG